MARDAPVLYAGAQRFSGDGTRERNDAVDDHGAFKGDVEAFVAWISRLLPRYDVTTHLLMNVLVEHHPTRDDVVRAETYGIAEHQTACRAMENVAYAMAVNRVGEERGFRFIGRSSIAGPSGETLARAGADEEAIIDADVYPERARQKRQVRVPGKHEIDRIADRRPSFYGVLVEPNGRD